MFSLLFLNVCIYYWVINKVSYTSSNDYKTPFNIDCWKSLESKYMQKVKLYLRYSPIRSKHLSENGLLLYKRPYIEEQFSENVLNVFLKSYK